jgi:hypothetical protein
MRLGGAEWYDDDAFAAYGVTGDQLRALRAWAISWCADIGRRLSLSESDLDDQ